MEKILKTTLFDINNINLKASMLFEGMARIALSFVMVAILGGIIWTTFMTFMELGGLLAHDIHEGLKIIMVNSLTILALLEVFETIRVYFSDGRVKVTFIIDTVLVVILTEVMVFWFKDIEYQKIMMVIALILTLMVARILAIKFSPGKYGLEEE